MATAAPARCMTAPRRVTRRRRCSDPACTTTKPAPARIGRGLHADHLGTKLVGDSACLPTTKGCWLYLACRLDLASHVGYAMTDHRCAAFVDGSLDMAHGRAVGNTAALR
ncbi:hypothetical protein NGM36_18050 [Streptomyces mutabilis]|uniref:hypothetical protein n=1 Tax=Streptomyces mutabilis TaxID=67332 RepID=UPI0022BA4442|nr:hypothetical protein [Streptomyces mutabilis]MCZ9351662.1 hypothetical protein [Streptomyces mutabilis]